MLLKPIAVGMLWSFTTRLGVLLLCRKYSNKEQDRENMPCFTGMEQVSPIHDSLTLPETGSNY